MEEKKWKVSIDKNQNHTFESPLILESIRENEKRKISSGLKLKSFNANIVTITQTHVFTSTIHPSATSPSLSSQTMSSKPISSSSNNYSNDQWQISFPILLTFAVIGILCLLSLLGFFTYYFLKKRDFCFHIKRKIHQDIDDGDDEKTLQNEKHSHSFPFLPSTSSPIINDLNLRNQYSWTTLNHSNRSLSIKDTNKSNMDIGQNKGNDRDFLFPSTFVPIDASSLTLVPRSLIWKDPNRRRGVDELDMWEKRQSQSNHYRYQQQISNGKQRQITHLPMENNIYDLKVEVENENVNEEDMDQNNNMDNDRPWQRYKLKSPISISHTLVMGLSDQENNHSNRSSNTLQSGPSTIIQENSQLVSRINDRQNEQVETVENNDKNNHNKVSDIILVRNVLEASASEVCSSRSLSSAASSNKN